MKRNGFLLLLLKVAIYGIGIFLLIAAVNVSVDASSVIRPQHTEMAKLSLAGETVATPENYNERVYQICIVNNMDHVPETIVVGSSRGMYLGTEITGHSDLYNHCVSGGCIEDYYALMGLYFNQFQALPKRVIIETSPWCFYENIPENRWAENDIYKESIFDFFKIADGEKLQIANEVTENPYLSLSYFRYNLSCWRQLGKNVFAKEKAHISTNVREAAEYPDGTIRYVSDQENESEARTESVKSIKGAVTYESVNEMTELSDYKVQQYEKLIDYLLKSGVEVIVYLQPFSVTQCEFSFDQNLNPGFQLTSDYLMGLSGEKGIEVRGGYDARDFGLTDKRFLDSMHLDKRGTNIVWNYDQQK